MKRIEEEGRLDEWCADNLKYFADTFGNKNIGWNSVDGTARCHWISSKKDEATSLDKANFEDNLVFDTSGVQWLFFRNGYSLPAGMTNGMKLLTESPFVSMDFSTGKFILNDTYNGKYGSDIK